MNAGFESRCLEMRAALRSAQAVGMRIGWPAPPPEPRHWAVGWIEPRVLKMRGDFRAADVPGMTYRQAENALRRLLRRGAVRQVSNGRGTGKGGLWRVEGATTKPR